MTYTAHITVMPLTELLDPQGKAVHESLETLGLSAIRDVRIGKHMTLQVEAGSRDEALELAEAACKKMLYNPVMEYYSIVVAE